MKKINKKAYRLKQLVDHLFEYALVAGDEEIELEEPELFETVFFDLFSETCNYLEQKEFTVDFDVEWVEQKISISTVHLADQSRAVKAAPDFPIPAELFVFN